MDHYLPKFNKIDFSSNHSFLANAEQGMDDRVVPPSMTDYISRILPAAVTHILPYEGHFSYFFFCDECHWQIFSTLFGSPQGPLEQKSEIVEAPFEGDRKEV